MQPHPQKQIFHLAAIYKFLKEAPLNQTYG
jgi:hypothetical protein